jgi:hypothetical protein
MSRGVARALSRSGEHPTHYRFITNWFVFLRNPYECFVTSGGSKLLCFWLFRGISEKTGLWGVRLKIPRCLAPWGFDPPFGTNQIKHLQESNLLHPSKKGPTLPVA